MKTTIQFFLLFMSATLFFACSNAPDGDKTEATDAKEVAATEGGNTYTVATDKSAITWEGTKPTGAHNGTINIKEGSLTISEDEIKGGSFVIDMSSIITTDLTGEQKGKLEGHLKSEDFFDVEKFPTAKFEITGSEKLPNDNTASHLIKGNLTMKEATKNVEFKAIVTVKEGSIKAKSHKFNIDRTEWDVRYGSNKFFDDLKDKFINDNIALEIGLSATK